MKKILLSVFVLAALGACTKDLNETTVSTADNDNTATIVNSADEAVRGEIVVKFKPEAESVLESTASRAGATLSLIHI